MNQILVTDKLYVTPELKRKKRLYKLNFIFSIVAIVILCSFYVHSEYARNKEQDIAQDILEGIVEEEMNESERLAASEEENVWKVMIAQVEQQQSAGSQQIVAGTQEGGNSANSINQQNTVNTTAMSTNSQNVMSNNMQNNQQTNAAQNQVSNSQNNSNNNTKKNSNTSNKKKKVKYITASNGKRYPSVGRIEIPKIGVNYAILAQASGDTLVDWLKISPVMFWGVYPNEVGNFSIAGHNYRNKRFFSKVPTLKKGDRIRITDAQGKKVNYTVFDKYEVNPKNTDCINDIPGKENKKIVTLITCTNDSKKRVIVHAEAN